jgi:hypothetical protein
MIMIDEAISALKAISIAEPRIGPPPSADLIAAAETKLSCKFPPSFLKFLAVAGSYQLSFWETYWVGPCDRDDIVEMNRQEREEASSPLPSYLVAFFNNGMGDQICFDTRTIDDNREYPIVFWNHELSQEENLKQLEQIAPNFAEWLMDEVKASDS